MSATSPMLDAGGGILAPRTAKESAWSQAIRSGRVNMQFSPLIQEE